jgi:excisionase family DNA binding protein
MNVTQWSDLPLVLTSDQAAAVLQLKRRTIANMLDRGDLHGVKVGKEWRVSRTELVRFVEGKTASTAGIAVSTADTAPSLTNKGGVLVVQADATADLTNFLKHEHDQRVAELIQQAAL